MRLPNQYTDGLRRRAGLGGPSVYELVDGAESGAGAGSADDEDGPAAEDGPAPSSDPASSNSSSFSISCQASFTA